MAKKVTAARLAAYDVLRDVDDRDAYANLALPAKIRAAGLSGNDAGLVTEIVSQTLRLQKKYDAIIAMAAGRETADIDARTLRVLRMGTHQLLAMRVAKHAVLFESVELQRLVANPKAAGFVNAVLRKINAKSASEWEQEILLAAADETASLAVQHSHPEWIVRALADALKSDGRAAELEALLKADNLPPRVQLALLPTHKTDSAEGMRQTASAALPDNLVLTGVSSNGAELVRISPEAALKKLSAAGIYARVQDQGSQLAAQALLQAKPLTGPETWLDLCAGPGGKTAFLAAHAATAKYPVSLRANEVSQHRAQLVANAVAEFSETVEIVNFDGTSAAAFGGLSYDRILVDAPCSGLGALRRRPEARWRKQPKDIPQLVKLQDQLLETAVAHLKPGGVLVYVTCSPHLAETKAVVQRLLRKQPDLELNSSEQLWPHVHNTDAMFISVFTKAGVATA